MKLVVGLGNPGKKYVGTRHNFGFALLDAWVRKHDLTFAAQPKFKSDLAILDDVTQTKIFFLKPQTYMNLSGESVASLCQFFKLAPKDILVAHDDLDLPLGQMRFAHGGSSAGHNGIKSIIQHLGTQEFARLKLGIGRPTHPGLSSADYVLQIFADPELTEVNSMLNTGIAGISAWLNTSLAATMNQFNQKK